MPPVTLDYQGHEAIAGFLRDINTWRGPRGYRLIPTRDDGQPAFGCGRNREAGRAAGVLVGGAEREDGRGRDLGKGDSFGGGAVQGTVDPDGQHWADVELLESSVAGAAVSWGGAVLAARRGGSSSGSISARH